MNHNNKKAVIQNILGYNSEEIASDLIKCVAHKGNPQFSNTGVKSTKNRHNHAEKLKVNHHPDTLLDWLAFSFPISSLTDKALKNNPLKIKFPSAEFPKETVISPVTGEELPPLPGVGVQRINKYGKPEVFFSNFARLGKLMKVAFGLTMGVPRGKGVNHYRESHYLFTPDGSNVGFVAHGGNNDTVFVNITGEGMRFVNSYRTPPQLYFWIDEYFQASSLSRVDIAFDDFDGNFTAQHCEDAYWDEAFKTSGKHPKLDPRDPKDRHGNSLGRTTYVGSRQSSTFWRTYDKAAEQGVEGVWWRNEAELKKCPVEILMDIDGIFAGLNKFAASMIAAEPLPYDKSKKRAERTMQGVLRWVRQVAAPTMLELARCISGISEAEDLDDGTILSAFKFLTDGIKPKSLGLPAEYYEPVPF